MFSIRFFHICYNISHDLRRANRHIPKLIFIKRRLQNPEPPNNPPNKTPPNLQRNPNKNLHPVPKILVPKHPKNVLKPAPNLETNQHPLPNQLPPIQSLRQFHL